MPVIFNYKSCEVKTRLTWNEVRKFRITFKSSDSFFDPKGPRKYMCQKQISRNISLHTLAIGAFFLDEMSLLNASVRTLGLFIFTKNSICSNFGLLTLL